MSPPSVSGQPAPAAVLAVDVHGDLALWSAQSASMFGYTHAEIVGRPVALLVAASQHVALQEAILRAQRDGTPVPALRLDACRKDHSTFPAEFLVKRGSSAGGPSWPSPFAI